MLLLKIPNSRREGQNNRGGDRLESFSRYCTGGSQLGNLEHTDIHSYNKGDNIGGDCTYFAT